MYSKTSSTNSRGAVEDNNAFNYSDMLDAQVRFLEGDLLTIIDATESDASKREATKSLIRKAVRERFNYMGSFVFSFPYISTLLERTNPRKNLNCAINLFNSAFCSCWFILFHSHQ